MTAKKQLQETAIRRNTISSVFVSVLIGLAFQEMVGPVRDSVRVSGITIGTVVLFSVFFLTCMRFFIGNQLHLISDNLLRMKGIVWFYDLFWIIIQTTVLIFLGGVSSVEVNRIAKVTFVDLLIVLYIIDVLWIISQWVLRRILVRISIPWQWAILNTCLIVGILLTRLWAEDVYSGTPLIVLGLLNAAAFVIDIFLSDSYDLI